MTGENRRRARRLPAQGLGTYVQAVGATFSQLPCFVEDISAGGMLLRTNHLLDVGTEVNLTLVRSGMRTEVEISGKVVGHRPAGGSRASAALRIAFRPPPPEVAVRLEELLKEFGYDGSSAELGAEGAESFDDPDEALEQLRRELDDAHQELHKRAERIAQLERQIDTARRVLGERDQ